MRSITGMDRRSAVEPTVAACACALEECAAFIAGLPEPAYTWRSARLAGSTIGQHARHALDHFGAVLAGIGTGEIDYDHRERNTPEETDGSAARLTIARLLRTLEGLDEEAVGAPVRVRVMLSARGDEAVHESTVGRELAFASHHALHHYAMMGSIAREQGRSAPDRFGAAPSTLHHRAMAGCDGRGVMGASAG